jgi:hypothetical protein
MNSGELLVLLGISVVVALICLLLILMLRRW